MVDGEVAPAIDIRTRLQRPAFRVWTLAATPEGVNAELAPLMAMTFPRGLGLLDVKPGQGSIASSWLLAFGFIPFDRHAFGLAKLHPMGFVEESSSWLQRRWRHERRIEATVDGCEVRDIVTVEPRLPFMAPLTRRMVAALFRHRHRRLAKLHA
jgi:ligand-binding SRPBCC domain-containing protein